MAKKRFKSSFRLKMFTLSTFLLNEVNFKTRENFFSNVNSVKHFVYDRKHFSDWPPESPKKT